MKTCSKCKQLQPSTAFHNSSRTRDGLQRWCIECSKTSSSRYYAANKTAVIARKRQHHAANMQAYSSWKETLECEACDENDSCCLDFHHRDSATKDGNISDMAANQGWSLKRLQDEISKCSILCSNCHRKIHKYKMLSLKDGTILTIAG